MIAPRRASDDPTALVERFVNGGGVLLGARRFWQGIDIPGDALQAVVIEKLPFEVPTELRKRRELRLAEHGVSSFERLTLGRMLLNLKQMVGRLIRSEDDRGIVVIVEGRAGEALLPAPARGAAEGQRGGGVGERAAREAPRRGGHPRERLVARAVRAVLRLGSRCAHVDSAL